MRNGDVRVDNAVSQCAWYARVRPEGVVRAAVRHAPQHSGHALREHRLENQVHEDQRQPEMHPAPKLVHHSASRFWKPIINAREKAEDRARRHHVMEMGNDIIGVVQRNIAEVKTQRQPGQAADAEHRQKSQSKEHRSIETYRAAPEGNKEYAQNDHRRNRDDHGCGLEKRADGRAHASQIHVVRPNDHREKADRKHRIDQRTITPNRLAGVVAKDLADNSHRRQDQNVNLRMPEKPKQVLPEKRAASTANGGQFACHDQSRRVEKARARHFVH